MDTESEKRTLILCGRDTQFGHAYSVWILYDVGELVGTTSDVVRFAELRIPMRPTSKSSMFFGESRVAAWNRAVDWLVDCGRAEAEEERQKKFQPQGVWMCLVCSYLATSPENRDSHQAHFRHRDWVEGTMTFKSEDENVG